MGHQGTRLSEGNQAEGDKYATERNLLGLQLRKQLNIVTWNVRILKECGKFNTVCKEMKRCSIQILGISEINWNDQGSFRAHTVEQCKIVEANRLANSTKDLYQGVRNITKKLKPANDTVKEEDGTIVYDGEYIKRGRKNTV